MQPLPRITVEVPVLDVGPGQDQYQELGPYVRALRRPQGLHMTLVHVGILDDLADEVDGWTKGRTSAADAKVRIAAWLRTVPVLAEFRGTADQLIVLGGGNTACLEVRVPHHVQVFQESLAQQLYELLDGLLVDKVDSFLSGSRALGWHRQWIPHVAVGRPLSRDGRPLPVPPLALTFGSSRVRNAASLP